MIVSTIIQFLTNNLAASSLIYDGACTWFICCGWYWVSTNINQDRFIERIQYSVRYVKGCVLLCLFVVWFRENLHKSFRVTLLVIEYSSMWVNQSPQLAKRYNASHPKQPLRWRHMNVMQSHITGRLMAYAYPHQRNIKVRITGPLWGEFTGHRHEGPVTRKCLDLMTSSWRNKSMYICMVFSV